MKTASKLFSVNFLALLKGFLIAFFFAFFNSLNNIIASTIATNVFHLTWVMFRPSIFYGLLAGFSYLVTNFFSNSKGQPFAKEPEYNPNRL
jgi:hypothetical protein